MVQPARHDAGLADDSSFYPDCRLPDVHLPDHAILLLGGNPRPDVPERLRTPVASAGLIAAQRLLAASFGVHTATDI